MDHPATRNVTELLTLFDQGDADAIDQLMPLVYDELRRLAQHLLEREPPEAALQATALVHDAYLRLVGQTRVAYRGRVHFLAVAAKMMRRILVDEARARHAAKRGGNASRMTLCDSVALVDPRESQIDLLALQEALSQLEQLQERQARVVELRFFAGMTVEETAEVLGVSPRTVKDDWRFARAWLQWRLSGSPSA